ncbi:MAG: hypothetical protein A2Y53_00730 [Chloroflexi bacterium RBG_16_47_49]|nr:MAG: hypothetical protein A2Y53_00730 [Chloroflexi bacterium RBG_16_47_49]
MLKKSQPTDIERYKQLVNALQELAAMLTKDLLLDYSVDAATRLSDAGSAWILFPDPRNEMLDISTGTSKDGLQLHGLSIPINCSIEGWVYSNKQPVMIIDTRYYDQSRGEFIQLPDIEIKSILIVPMISKGKQIGVLEVINKRVGEFSPLDREILAAFAHQAAICIDNSHRFIQSDLVTELVHELRTPLAALNTALYLLQRSDISNERREQISQLIHTEFNRLSELTTSFLEYARLKSGRAKFELTRFDLTQLIKESIEIIQIQLDSKGLTISLSVPAEPLYITADKDKIKQVILNLLNNAIKYNRLGGKIHFIANISPTDISFSIQDNGLGIRPEHLPLLFERFYRGPDTDRKILGTGLGLSICKQIVEAHNGKIEVSSTVGQGSTFTVQLPINQSIKAKLVE